MIAAATPSRAGPIALWVARVMVAIPFFIAAGIEGLSSPATLAELNLVWIPDAPLWLVRLVAAVEGLTALGLILPGLARLQMGIFVTLLILTVLILGALTFFPVLALGPIAEETARLAGQSF
jgi:hypothetical protein